MREWESVAEKDKGGERKKKREKKKDRKAEEEDKMHLCTKIVLKGNKHTHPWEFEMETEKDK